MTAVLQPGSTFAGYEIQSRVGQGGMAVVYLAWDPHLERKVALKILNEALSEDESFQQRFIRESKMAASLGHPNVVPVFSAGESDGVLYIAMQYVDGIDLKVLIKQEQRLDPARTMSIVGQVGKALDAAQRLALTHRDVKPANILIVPRPDEDSEDQAYLTDFGLTKRGGQDTGLTVTGQFLGTLDYVAPEQIQGGDVDGRVDVYALGCVLYQCLTGTPPFLRENEAALIYAHLLDPPPMLSETRSDLSPEIDAVIAKAMAKSREDRYPTAAALCSAARTALARDMSTTPATTTPAATDRTVEVPPVREQKPVLAPPLAKPRPVPPPEVQTPEVQTPEVQPAPTPELEPKPPPAQQLPREGIPARTATADHQAAEGGNAVGTTPGGIAETAAAPGDRPGRDIGRRSRGRGFTPLHPFADRQWAWWCGEARRFRLSPGRRSRAGAGGRPRRCSQRGRPAVPGGVDREYDHEPVRRPRLRWIQQLSAHAEARNKARPATGGKLRPPVPLQ